ncbi:MAG: hypothetical protein WBP56_01760 [Polyangia bacterium]
MFKMSICGGALFLAGVVGLACSSSGLKSRAGDGGVASGGQAGSTISSGTTGGTAAYGGTMAQGGRTASGGSTATGGNGGTGATGGASSSCGVSCLDSSGTIATTAKTCTLASDCKQAVQPTCCGYVSVVGLSNSSSCTFTFSMFSCGNLGCASSTYQQAEDGKNTAQGGTIGVQCVSGQCMTFVMAGGVDAAIDANVNTAAPSCFIAASHYDQSCSADLDCVRVDFGNYCQWLCRCGGDAINRASLSQFNADIAMTPLGQGCISGACSCGVLFGPCCRGGQCTAGTACETDGE